MRAGGVGRIANTTTIWLERPIWLERGVSYDIEHSLRPTDVKNHFSGFPFTVAGAELWTCFGRSIDPLVDEGVAFSFGKSSQGGRCCLEEGQIPFLKFWKA